MKKSVFISHGDKGGCGKSVLANTVASILEINQKPFLLVEADATINGGQPDVAPMFEMSEFAQVVKAPISGSSSPADIIADLFEIIENSDAEYVVINTPAGASETLDAVGELIGEACNSLDYRLVVFYSVFKTDVAVNQARRALQGSLAKGADEFYFVKNEYFGMPNMTTGELAKVPYFTVPILSKNVMDRIGPDVSFSKALSVLSVIQRIQLDQYFQRFDNQGFNDVLLKNE